MGGGIVATAVKAKHSDREETFTIGGRRDGEKKDDLVRNKTEGVTVKKEPCGGDSKILGVRGSEWGRRGTDQK